MLKIRRKEEEGGDPPWCRVPHLLGSLLGSLAPCWVASSLSSSSSLQKILSFFFPFFFFFSSFSFFEKERERESLGFRSPPGLLGLKKKATPTQWLGLKGVGNEAYNDRCFPPLHVSNERRGFLMEAFQHLSFFFLSSCLPTLFTLHSCSIVAGK